MVMTMRMNGHGKVIPTQEEKLNMTLQERIRMALELFGPLSVPQMTTLSTAVHKDPHGKEGQIAGKLRIMLKWGEVERDTSVVPYVWRLR